MTRNTTQTTQTSNITKLLLQLPGQRDHQLQGAAGEEPEEHPHLRQRR